MNQDMLSMYEWSMTEYQTPGRIRTAIVERDGTCVVTGVSAEDCDASHCLPYSKDVQGLCGHFLLMAEPMIFIEDSFSQTNICTIFCFLFGMAYIVIHFEMHASSNL